MGKEGVNRQIKLFSLVRLEGMPWRGGKEDEGQRKMREKGKRGEGERKRREKGRRGRGEGETKRREKKGEGGRHDKQNSEANEDRILASTRVNSYTHLQVIVIQVEGGEVSEGPKVRAQVLDRATNLHLSPKRRLAIFVVFT